MLKALKVLFVWPIVLMAYCAYLLVVVVTFDIDIPESWPKFKKTVLKKFKRKK